jgi:hypothetical protein
MMLPAFLPAEGFLVYSGSVNGKSPIDGIIPILTFL